MNGHLRILASLFLFLTACVAGGGESVTLLHTNDTYSIVSGADGSGGAARVATVIGRLRAERPGALLLHSGDFLSPELMSGVFRGRQMIDTMNLLKYDYVTLGNHEFDFGLDVLDQRIGESRFHWLISNLTRNGAPWPGSHPGRVVVVNGRRIGFFGLLTPDTVTIAGLPPDVAVDNPVEAGRDEARRLRGEGAEAVVALTHLSWAEDRRLAEEVPEIDLILGGHDHDKGTVTAGRTVIVKSGADWKWVGVVRFVPGGAVSVE
ncbi:MAG: metallophosphoesterase, partial [Nitrospinae bacterium]|nr:metallophosphoesterase [Nitrospinota bacterium]